MRHVFLAISLLLALSGCTPRQRVPGEIQDAHAKAADFRQNAIKKNVETVVEDLLSKLEQKWVDENSAVFEAEVFKLKVARDNKVKEAPDKAANVLEAYKAYDLAFDSHRLQMKKANDLNHEKLKDYKVKNLDNIKEQFDRSQRIDTAIMRYMMGLKPGPFDKFLTGSAELVEEPKKDK